MKLFAVPSVDRALAFFHRAAAALEAVIEHHVAQAEEHGKAIVAATEAKLKSDAEVLRAKRIVEKLGELLK